MVRLFSVQPQISAEVQLVGAPRHTETTLTCTAEVRLNRNIILGPDEDNPDEDNPDEENNPDEDDCGEDGGNHDDEGFDDPGLAEADQLLDFWHRRDDRCK